MSLFAEGQNMRRISSTISCFIFEYCHILELDFFQNSHDEGVRLAMQSLNSSGFQPAGGFLYIVLSLCLLHEHSTMINTHCIQGTCPPSIKSTPVARPPIMLTVRVEYDSRLSLSYIKNLNINCATKCFKAYHLLQI